MTLLFHIWNMALQCVEIYLINGVLIICDEREEKCVHYLFANNLTFSFPCIFFERKKTAAAVQQLEKNTSCTLHLLKEIFNVEKSKKARFFHHTLDN